MFNALWSFIQERYVLKATMPLALLLSLGPLCLMNVSLLVAMALISWVFFVLLILRIADDITSIEEDKLSKPNRKLANGVVSYKLLQLNLIWLTLIVAFIGVYLDIFWHTVVVMIFYVFYFLAIKPCKLLLLDAYLINLIFFFLPLLAYFVNNGIDVFSVIIMAVFYWSSAVGHDYAHSVENKTKNNFHWHASYLYIVSFCIGIYLAIEFEFAVGFLTTLISLFFYICFLLIQLIKRPNEISAKPFYIMGYVYFLMPIVFLFVENNQINF